MMGRKLGIKDLTDPSVQASLTDAQAATDIKDGVTVNGTQKMKAFGDNSAMLISKPWSPTFVLSK